ncbi:hypothetical protein M0L20_27150 [Spirosoma sp. RP8]|uniref:Uncharacterized protein n=1 Tax=Spirosoma liriopis TaxID=2937440 RepID=A0ABT0HTP6_9BACT|nr:hypothetical protein [Spirosoma liriopis]MCK8495573.1 hypothetical protein [Spirosoma liriopis]
MNSSIPVDSFIRFFSDQLVKLESLYKWPVRLKTKEALPGFPWHEWAMQSGSASECIALKKYLTQAWNTSDEADKKKLARWIVTDWGGVRSNRPARLEAHWHLIHGDLKKMPVEGIASYSKILTLKDCTQYAIYDARVAACLNAIQLQMKPDEPVFFPYIPSQNQYFRQWPKSENFVNVFSKRRLVSNDDWHELEKHETYTAYLNLLYALKGSFPGTEIYHFEMILFSLAIQLCPQLTEAELNLA